LAKILLDDYNRYRSLGFAVDLAWKFSLAHR
jgi:hypothetical protein